MRPELVERQKFRDELELGAESELEASEHARVDAGLKLAAEIDEKATTELSWGFCEAKCWYTERPTISLKCTATMRASPLECVKALFDLDMQNELAVGTHTTWESCGFSSPHTLRYTWKLGSDTVNGRGSRTWQAVQKPGANGEPEKESASVSVRFLIVGSPSSDQPLRGSWPLSAARKGKPRSSLSYTIFFDEVKPQHTLATAYLTVNLGSTAFLFLSRLFPNLTERSVRNLRHFVAANQRCMQGHVPLESVTDEDGTRMALDLLACRSRADKHTKLRLLVREWIKRYLALRTLERRYPLLEDLITPIVKNVQRSLQGLETIGDRGSIVQLEQLEVVALGRALTHALAEAPSADVAVAGWAAKFAPISEIQTLHSWFCPMIARVATELWLSLQNAKDRNKFQNLRVLSVISDLLSTRNKVAKRFRQTSVIMRDSRSHQEDTVQKGLEALHAAYVEQEGAEFLFNRFDRSGVGMLTKEDLVMGFEGLGISLRNALEIEQLYLIFGGDDDGDNRADVSYTDFVKALLAYERGLINFSRLSANRAIAETERGQMHLLGAMFMRKSVVPYETSPIRGYSSERLKSSASSRSEVIRRSAHCTSLSPAPAITTTTTITCTQHTHSLSLRHAHAQTQTVHTCALAHICALFGLAWANFLS